MISIIVPCYNHASFLKIRIDSILSQTFQDFELILLDDCSNDNSWRLLQSYSSHPKVSHCQRNVINSGSPFKQWKKGIELAEGELIWIAESDDWAEPEFLEQSISLLNTEELSLVISGSQYIDSDNLIIGEVISEYDAGIFDGNQFCSDFMYFRNGILNASGVIFSKANVHPDILFMISDFKLSGDHLFWAHLMKDQRIGVLDKKHNYFRWHNNSVRVSESNKLTELLEGIRIKKWIEKKFKIESDQMLLARKNAYLIYFKSLKLGIISKNITEFFNLWKFFNPLDKFKSVFRYYFA